MLGVRCAFSSTLRAALQRMHGSRTEEDIGLRGGPVVRFSTSTEWATAYVQKEVGAPLATKLERASSMMLRIARSATPFSWWTCGGHVKFTGVVAVERTYNAGGSVATFIEQSSESGQEAANGVTSSPVHGWEERPADIDVDETARVRRGIQFLGVRQARGACFSARLAGGHCGMTQALRSV
eukprot:2141436-Pleurochrysis_carterae.AAC.1